MPAPPRDLIPAPLVPAPPRGPAGAPAAGDSWTISFDEPAPPSRVDDRARTRKDHLGPEPPPVRQDDRAVTRKEPGGLESGPGRPEAITRKEPSPPEAATPGRPDAITRREPSPLDEPRPAMLRPLAGKTGRPVAVSGRISTRSSSSQINAEGKQVRLLPGRRVPGTRYRLIRWLGEGGMGVVYEAEHEDIERRVALKILRHEASEDPQQAAHFRDEARAASRIGSPNIVEIFDFGELPDGRLMFAMELLNGHGLDSELDKCPMDQARMIGILRQVCKGLAAAHEVGIIHRDVKPDNIILVTHNGKADWVKVVDFGIATVHAETDAGAAGTPHYMAPEQVLGQPFDGRLDMYSFGCTAYELLVGKPPFVAPTIEEILENQLTQSPTPPSELCPPGSVHPALEAVILRCLEKEPTSRYRDMRDVEAALCEAQIAAGLHTAYDDLPLPDVDPDRYERLRKDMPQPGVVRQRRRWLWPAIAGASTMLALLLGLALWNLRRLPAPEEQLVVDNLVNEARAAGARAHWVYPPEDQPDLTALLKIRDLEELRGAARHMARTKATELREEFAQTLVRLGDQYWDMDGGKPFARDYYIQAVLFDPGDVRARERSGVTPGFVSDLEERALSGGFTPAELRNTGVLVALAEQDTAKRDQALLDLVDEEDSTSLVIAASAEKLVQSTQARPKGRRPGEPRPEVGVAEPGQPPPAAAQPEPEPAPATPGKPAPSSKRDAKHSTNLAQEARAALASGDRKRAETLFHQALAADNRNAVALIGLSDLEFDKGAHQRAADYAEKAIAAAPKTALYHLKLGDAYFKLLRYADARRAYDKAKELGSRDADERLTKLKAKLGK
ncbi:protein kinase domain-containing protein [Nannocystis punicea]|uniref:Protein kinase n=1 Tax=Nannocystis punicea TaxID=2995304 RepID=A0ABY7GZS7_9BACT|nr:protein kinase [Nannocystis poenicansa]WAS92452.1 protein kinase [Nannocystis poenicansa]